MLITYKTANTNGLKYHKLKILQPIVSFHTIMDFLKKDTSSKGIDPSCISFDTEVARQLNLITILNITFHYN
jgi:hypothetical protein